jgi:GT2 family glycosyltransferase
MENPSNWPTVDVVTVFWKSAPFLPALFEGLARLDYPRERFRFHVVDNNPGDGSLEEARRQIAKWGDALPEIKIHEPGFNTGFAGGNNLVMRQAIAEGREYVYLHNHDAQFEPGALKEAVRLAETDTRIGSVQSLLVLEQDPDEINSTGNAIHYLGFGYCADYHLNRKDVPLEPKEIAYATGAAVLFPTRVLQEVGLLDETLWLYHEDLDLGWRILLAGYKNVLAPQSVMRHHYEFSRSIAKWYWMERNRMAVLIKNYHWLTLTLLLPQLFVLEIALWVFSFKGGWWREKARADSWFFSWKTWKYLLDGHRHIAQTRKVGDRDILKRFTPVVAYQEFESPLISAVVNPAWSALFWILRKVVVW